MRTICLCAIFCLLVMLMLVVVPVQAGTRILADNTTPYGDIALDQSDLPVAAYMTTNGDIHVLKCATTNCSSVQSDIIVATITGGFGSPVQIEIDSNNNPTVILYEINGIGRFRIGIIKCNTPMCSGAPALTFLTGYDAENDFSFVLDASDNPVISYPQESADSLSLLRCDTPDCSTFSNAVVNPPVAPGNRSGLEPSLVLNSVGNPVISHLARLNPAIGSVVEVLRLSRCLTSDCQGTVISTDIIPAGIAFTQGGVESSIQLNSSELPMIVFTDFNGIGGSVYSVRVVNCLDIDCNTYDVITLASGNFHQPVLRFDSSENAQIIYGERVTNSSGPISLDRCIPASCTASLSSIIIDTGFHFRPGLVLDQNDNTVINFKGRTSDPNIFQMWLYAPPGVCLRNVQRRATVNIAGERL